MNIYKRTGTTWSLDAQLRPANGDDFDYFGKSVSLDSDTIAVGAHFEDSNRTTIVNSAKGDPDDNLYGSGAVYMYRRIAGSWQQRALIKAVNASSQDEFGSFLSLSGDRPAAGAPNESSNQATITNGSTASGNESVLWAGAVYVYRENAGIWSQEAFVKPRYTNEFACFGSAVSLSGNSLAVGAPGEDNMHSGISSGSSLSPVTSAGSVGAVYLFRRPSSIWTVEAYSKLKMPEAEMHLAVL